MRLKSVWIWRAETINALIRLKKRWRNKYKKKSILLARSKLWLWFRSLLFVVRSSQAAEKCDCVIRESRSSYVLGEWCGDRNCKMNQLHLHVSGDQRGYARCALSAHGIVSFVSILFLHDLFSHFSLSVSWMRESRNPHTYTRARTHTPTV